MRMKIMLFAMFLAILFLSRPVFAGDGNLEVADKDFIKKAESRMQELFKELDLSEEQRSKLKENKMKHREEIKAMYKRVREAREAMRQELQKSELDMARIGELQSEIKAAQASMADHKLQGIIEVRKILTPEQFKKFMDKTGRGGFFKEKRSGFKGGSDK